MLALTKVLSKIRLILLLIAIGMVMTLYGFYLSTVATLVFVT